MENVTINSIEDARRYAIKVLEEAIQVDINEIMIARKQEIPIDFNGYYEEISRLENLINYHNKKLA